MGSALGISGKLPWLGLQPPLLSQTRAPIQRLWSLPAPPLSLPSHACACGPHTWDDTIEHVNTMCICLGVCVHGNVGDLGGTVRNDLGRKYSLGWGTTWDYGTFTCTVAHWRRKTLGPWPTLSLPGAMLGIRWCLVSTD